MTPDEILSEIKEKDVKYVDVRFTDIRGKLQHVTFDIDLVDEEFLTEGTMFDGSSIAGWKAINESDMLLRPDLQRLHRSLLPADHAVPVLRRAEPRQPSPITATRARSPRRRWPTPSRPGIGDQVYFGPEAEFFLFDDVRWSTARQHDRLQLRRRRAAGQHRQELRRGQHGPSARAQGRLFPGQPCR